MGFVAQKQELFENIARLRRVGRELPSSPDLAMVRLALEEQLGQTVSRRLAARLLGVSHTALERWVKSGDLPVVRSSAGREEIPVPALLDLYEAVRVDRSAAPGRFALAATMARQRDAARRLRLDGVGGAPRRVGHDRARARSLAYHRAVASKLSKPMVAEARHVLFRWREQGRIDQRYAERWEELLAMRLPAIRRAITAPGPDADDLRQNSPFAGALSEPERQRILTEVS
jgi:hypothetical protein